MGKIGVPRFCRKRDLHKTVAVTLSDGQVVHQRLVRSWPLIACQKLCRKHDGPGGADGPVTKKAKSPEAEANAAANAKRAAERKAANELKEQDRAAAAKKKAEPKQKLSRAEKRLVKAAKEAAADTTQSKLHQFIERVVQDGQSSTPEPNAGGAAADT